MTHTSLIKAGVPRGYRDSSSLYKNGEQQENSHIETLRPDRLGRPFCIQLTKMIEDVYNEKSTLNFPFSCSAMTCKVYLKKSNLKRTLTIAELVFCDRTEQYRLVEMFISAAINLCTRMSDSEKMNLHILDPIPSVKMALERTWCMWCSEKDDPYLPSERMEEASKLIPVEIRATGCCLTRNECFGVSGEHRSRQGKSLRLDLKIPKVDDQPSYGIGENYLTSLECLLYRIYLFVKDRKEGSIILNSDSACVEVRLNSDVDVLELYFIATRLCLGRLKIATMIYWRLMACCAEFKISCFTVTAFPSNAILLERLGGFIADEPISDLRTYNITLDIMHTKTLANCGLEGRLSEHEDFPGYFSIDPSHFPVADELNSQQAVDARYAKYTNTVLAALVPDNCRLAGSLYSDSRAQEEDHTTDLSQSRFCEEALRQLLSLIRGAFVKRLLSPMIIECNAFKCIYNVCISSKTITINDLVFCSRAWGYKVIDMFTGTLVTLCKYIIDEPFSLKISNPIQSVRDFLLCSSHSWVPSTYDLLIPSDRIGHCFDSIPDFIKSTGCCQHNSAELERYSFKVKMPILNDDVVHDFQHCIAKDYITSLECLLYRLSQYFKIERQVFNYLRTDAACVDLKFTGKSTCPLSLTCITVRPCLQGRKIAHMILFAIMNGCVQHEIPNFTGTSAYASSASILKKLGFNISRSHILHNDYTISLDDMRKNTLAACGLEGILTEDEHHPGYFVINRTHLPHYSSLNVRTTIPNGKKRKMDESRDDYKGF